MSLSMYQASAPVFVAMLNNLAAILEKAEAYAKERKIDESVLLNWRFAPDMFPLTRQVQIATDFAKGTTARLAGVDVPKYADDEASFAALRQRIVKTLTFVEAFRPADTTARRAATSRSRQGAGNSASRGRLISSASPCRTSIFTSPRPTTSCALAGWE